MKMRGLVVVLFMVVAVTIASSAEARRTYTIQPGDTPDGLRLKFAPTLEELRRANQRVNFNLLRVGDEVVDPRPEQSDLDVSLREIADLHAKLVSITGERDRLRGELSSAGTHIDELRVRVDGLAPLAAEAENYRDRFNSWVGVLVVALVIALITTWVQVRARVRFDRKILEMQKELAAERNVAAIKLARHGRDEPLSLAGDSGTSVRH